ncbi:MAG: apolipoprotein N-acyltransferase [Bacteroidales bacterium]|nr:apolipoprotein N-acyltransferase [Bacteroidales bacterium]
MKNHQKLIMAVASGLLLWAAWPLRGFAPLIFIALVPLLYLEERISKGERGNIFWLSFVTFLVWNVLTTWWVWNATPAAILAWILNSLFMSIVFWAFHHTKMKLSNDRLGNFLLIPYWMAFEFLHYYWAAKWPWLSLGNVFSTCTTWVQWYSVTGVAGGTLWILLVNILITNIVSSYKKTKLTWWICATVALIALPIIGSKIAYNRYEEKGVDTEVVVVQQNCDPWNEQFDKDFFDSTIKRNADLAEKVITPETRFIVSSESAIQEGIWLDKMNEVRALKILGDFIEKHPQACFVIGGTTYEWVPRGMEDDFPARQIGKTDRYYYAHNSALLIDTIHVQHRNKSKLTPAVEAIPEWMGFLKNYSLTMGIARGTLKTDPFAMNMSFGDHKVGVPICYESAFGGYVSEFTRKGADLLFVITNDGWWGDTPGYRQHFEFSKLRAIENRRCVARSANTGTSGFINQRGDVLQKTEYWKEDIIKATLKANTEKTFYSKHGDYLYRIAMWLTYGLLLVTLVLSVISLVKKGPASKKTARTKKG